MYLNLPATEEGDTPPDKVIEITLLEETDKKEEIDQEIEVEAEAKEEIEEDQDQEAEETDLNLDQNQDKELQKKTILICTLKKVLKSKLLKLSLKSSITLLLKKEYSIRNIY